MWLRAITLHLFTYLNCSHIEVTQVRKHGLSPWFMKSVVIEENMCMCMYLFIFCYGMCLYKYKEHKENNIRKKVL